MKTVAEVIGVSRSNLVERLQERPKKRIGRPPLPDDELVAEIEAVIAELPTYGYRRGHSILKRRGLGTRRQAPNHKRVYRVMKAHGLVLDRHAGGAERRHDGRIAVDERNRRWCSDGFEIGCDNGDKVRIAFALDCCDREAMSFLATTSGIRGEDVRDLMLEWTSKNTLSRSEAIRQLIEQGLTRKAVSRPLSNEAAHKALKMAARELQPLGDKSLPAGEPDRHKR